MDFELVLSIIPRLMEGAWVTVTILVQSVLLGLIIAVPMALARVSHNPALWMPAYAYIFFFRGTPLLVQIFLIYYGLGQFAFIRDSFAWVFLREAYWCAVLALALNTAGYTAEILRGGIKAVPRGEIEAARACGMSPGMLYRRIILPKAARLALPAYGNEVILLLKGSALVFTITVVDLLGAANMIRTRTFQVYEPLLAAAILYLAMTFVLTRLFAWLEYRLNPQRRGAPAVPAVRPMSR